MLGMVGPAPNEAALIGDCLAHLLQAAQASALAQEPVSIVVVLDDCSDATKSIVQHYARLTGR